MAKKPAEYQDIIQKRYEPVPADHHLVPAREYTRVSLLWIFLASVLYGSGTIDKDVFRVFEVSGG